MRGGRGAMARLAAAGVVVGAGMLAIPAVARPQADAPGRPAPGTGAMAGATTAGAGPAEVLILGVYHFANPGLDVIQTDVADVLAPDKQAEIEAVVEALGRFRPTRIAVEHLPSTAPVLDSLYAEYRAGRHALARNETQQLGFRLAARFDHDGVHPIDHQGSFPFEAVMAYAREHDPGFLAFVGAEMARITEEENRLQREVSVGRNLRERNLPANLAWAHGLYLEFAGVGAGDGYVGADVLARWYERNIRIYANVRQITRPGDRVLVVIGSGHAPILRELVSYDAGLVLVEAVDYLPDE
jgi:hypothetical protein